MPDRRIRTCRRTLVECLEPRMLLCGSIGSGGVGVAAVPDGWSTDEKKVLYIRARFAGGTVS